MIQPGEIGFSDTKGKIFLSGLIRFFTKSTFSHSFICYYPLQDMEMVFEANELMMLTPFDHCYRQNDTQVYEIWKIKDMVFDTAKSTKQEVMNNLKQLYITYTNVKYGYTQLVWFIYRWFREIKLVKKIFGKLDLSKDRKFFTKGLLCSELVYLYLISLNHSILNEELKNYCANTIVPEDIRNIFLKYPEYFEISEKK